MGNKKINLLTDLRCGALIHKTASGGEWCAFPRKLRVNRTGLKGYLFELVERGMKYLVENGPLQWARVTHHQKGGDYMPTITTKELTTLKIAKRYHHTIKSRLAIVHYATEHGLKGAARRFGLGSEDGPSLAASLAGQRLRGPDPALSPDPSTPDSGFDRGVD
jgi:hypothetical protein